MLLKIYSFDVKSDFGLFRDPSINTNKVTYIVPSKSMVMGLLGAIIGIKRPKVNDPEIYSDDFISFFQKTKIGIQLNSIPNKVVLYTNHISIKEAKTKPTKGELLLKPQYKIFFRTDEHYLNELTSRIPGKGNLVPESGYVYTPYLGHAYCLASLNNLQKYDLEGPANQGDIDKDVTTVFLGKDGPKSPGSGVTGTPKPDMDMLIEWHLHHFMEKITGKKHTIDELASYREVLKYYIPVNRSHIEASPEDCKALGMEFYPNPNGLNDDSFICLF